MKSHIYNPIYSFLCIRTRIFWHRELRTDPEIHGPLSCDSLVLYYGRLFLEKNYFYCFFKCLITLKKRCSTTKYFPVEREINIKKVFFIYFKKQYQKLKKKFKCEMIKFLLILVLYKIIYEIKFFLRISFFLTFLFIKFHLYSFNCYLFYLK
jgi:hypothetical protein